MIALSNDNRWTVEWQTWLPYKTNQFHVLHEFRCSSERPVHPCVANKNISQSSQVLIIVESDVNETGRWSKPRNTPLNERTCFNCNVIGDEFHFVREWKLFTYIRNRYIPSFYRNHASMYKLITLINNENKNIIRSIYSAFELRNSKHYV